MCQKADLFQLKNCNFKFKSHTFVTFVVCVWLKSNDLAKFAIWQQNLLLKEQQCDFYDKDCEFVKMSEFDKD